MRNKVEFAEKALSRQLEWISKSDAKIPVIFAINSAMLGYVISLLPNFKSWTICITSITLWVIILLSGSVALLALAAFPRLKGPKSSLLFFGSIVKRDEVTYIREMRDITDNDLVEDLLKQTYRNSQIAAIKYSYIKWATISTFISFPFWLITLWFLYR